MANIRPFVDVLDVDDDDKNEASGSNWPLHRMFGCGRFVAEAQVVRDYCRNGSDTRRGVFPYHLDIDRTKDHSSISHHIAQRQS